MITIRSPLFLLGCLALFGGCASKHAVCPFPGATQTRTCYYQLTITKKDSNGVRGQVARAAVEGNIAQLPWYVKSYNIEDYQFFEYPIPLDKETADKVEIGKDYWFVSEVSKPPTDRLKLTTPSAKTPK